MTQIWFYYKYTVQWQVERVVEDNKNRKEGTKSADTKGKLI